jgi:hypothetical protein
VLHPEGATLDGRPVITLHRGFFAQDARFPELADRQRAVWFIHEGIHTTSGEIVFRGIYDSGVFNQIHDNEYNRAAERLYEDN